MGAREASVEKYFDQQVKTKLKGITRKWENRHHAGVPDRIPIWPEWNHGQLFVEMKTLDGKVTAIQHREHVRLREAGAMVFVCFGHHGVNQFIEAALDGKLEAFHTLEQYTF